MRITSWRFWLAVSSIGILATVSDPSSSASGPEKPGAKAAATPNETEEGLDLKKRFHEFAREAFRLRWELEDKWVNADRTFLDELRKTIRDADTKARDEVLGGIDWKRARREAKDRRRVLLADIKQRIKVKREQLELELMRFQQDREKELKEFMEKLELDLATYSKDKAFQRARDDFRNAREELRNELKRWHSWMRAQRIKEVPSP